MSIREKQTADGPRFSVYLKNKNFPRYVGTWHSHKEAEHAEEEEKVRRRKVQRGELPPTQDPRRTFEQSINSWLKALEKKGSRSRKGYGDRVRLYLLPRFKAVLLSALQKPAILRLQEDMATKFAPSTVNGTIACLSSAFSWFKDRGWATENPCHGIETIANDATAYDWIRSEEEITRLLSVCSAELRDIVATAVLTGMRIDEVAHLHWPDINLDRRLITVQRGHQGPTKSGKIRHVPILNPLLPVLRARSLKRDGELLVFRGDQEGGTRAKQAIRRAFKRALDRAGMDTSLRFHDLRHTFASHWMIGKGCIFKLSKVLGHSSVSITEKIYAHLSPSAFQEDYGRLTVHVPTEEAAIVETLRDERGRIQGTRTLKLAR